MELNKKIFISNIITFIILLLCFFLIYLHLQELNFESQYRYYAKYGNSISSDIDLNNITIINNSDKNKTLIEPTEEFNIDYKLIILVAVALISIINNLKYIVDDFYKNHKKDIKEELKI